MNITTVVIVKRKYLFLGGFFGVLPNYILAKDLIYGVGYAAVLFFGNLAYFLVIGRLDVYVYALFHNHIYIITMFVLCQGVVLFFYFLSLKNKNN